MASECVHQTWELILGKGKLLTLECVCQTQELRATKVNYLLYINEWIRF